MFPNENSTTILRFLIARRGNVKLASEMLTASLSWREHNIPMDMEFIRPAFMSKCMFIHKQARDGTPGNGAYLCTSIFDHMMIDVRISYLL